MIKDTLFKLLETYGATGKETSVAELLREMLTPHADSVREDVMGNLIFTKHGEGKRILFSAHMDHIGLVVVDADKHGFLRVAAVGGLTVDRVLGQHVVFADGLQGVVFVQQDIEGAPKLAHLYIDIGAENREDALTQAGIGSVAVVAPQVSELGAYRVASPAMDDRAGCALLAELLMGVEDCPNELVCVFSTQEEVGLRGAQVAGYAEAPDIAIALDVTPATDAPGGRPKLPVKLGMGPAIKVMDNSLIATPMVREAMVEAAKEADVPYQMEVLPFGGTDAGAIQRVRGGVPSGVLSIPCRYVHNAIETVDMRDMEHGLELLKTFVDKEF